jgi:hypothetical protein
MQITSKQLRQMIIQEMRKVKKVKRVKRLQEGSAARPIKLTARTLNRIIKEEYAAFNRKQRLTEAKRRRLAEVKRRRLRKLMRSK